MVWGNTAIEVHMIAVESERLPEAFSGYRIAHVSDLHNKEFGKGNERLLDKIRKSEPDMIAITGDIVHSSAHGVQAARSFIQEASKIAPCCFVTGNHEAWITEVEYRELEQVMQEAGVQILRDSRVFIEKAGAVIAVAGIDDPFFAEEFQMEGISMAMDAEGLAQAVSENIYTVLLTHRPEYFDIYCEAGIDLVLSGHAHGGQFRLPFVGGLIAPDQGLFPEYAGGQYEKDGTIMIVSRGLARETTRIPRIFNRPELVILEIT